MSVPRQSLLKRRFLPWIAALLTFASASALATTYTWTGSAGDNNIATAGNWNPTAVPASGDTLIFSGAAGLTPRLSSTLSVSSLSFDTAASAFTLGGTGTYTTGTGGIANKSAFTQTINTAIALCANNSWTATTGNLAINGAVNLSTRTLTLTGSDNILVAGGIGGSGGITKTGTGTLTLTGSNSFTGALKLSAGTLLFGNTYAGGAGAVSLGTGAIDATGGAETIGNAVTLAGNTSYLGNFPLTFSGAASLTGNRTLTLEGTNTLTFSGVVSARKTTYTLTEKGTGTLAPSQCQHVPEIHAQRRHLGRGQ